MSYFGIRMDNMSSHVQKFLRQNKREVSAGKGWSALVEELGIGAKKGRKIIFNDKDLAILKSNFNKRVGGDILTFDFKQDRVKISEKLANEKIGTGDVFGNQLLLARGKELPIIIGGRQTFTPEGSLISTPVELVELSLYDKVLIVENGAIMTNWHKLSLPTECQDSLIIYRGHGTAAKGLVNNIKELKVGVLHYYYDFDPTGLAMSLKAIQQGAKALVPHNWQEIASTELFEQSNKRDVYIKQLKTLQRLEENHNGEFSDIIDYMRKHELAITQEALMSHETRLMVIG